MKKQFLISAIALAAAGAANAQLSLYGLLDVSYGKSLLGDVFLDQKADIHSGGDNSNSEGNSTSRFGLKGSTDLGGGFKANFNLQSNGITSNGGVNDPFFGRQAWVGLSGSFGEFRVGRQDSVPFQTMVDFDFNGASNGVSAGAYSGVGVFNRGRQSHSLQYITPSLSGFSAQVGFQPKGSQTPGDLSTDAAGNLVQDRGDKSVFSFGAKYATGPVAVAASYQSKSDSSVKDAFVSFAGTYDLGVAKFMLGYADGGKAVEGGTGKGLSAGVNVPVAGWNFGGIYAKNSDDDLKLTSYELYVNKEIFKNTILYTEYGNWKTSLAVNPLAATAKTKGTGFAVGLIYVF